MAMEMGQTHLRSRWAAWEHPSGEDAVTILAFECWRGTGTDTFMIRLDGCGAADLPILYNR